MSRLTEKSAIVTGGGSGIGRAVARRFAEEGAAVIVLDRDEVAAKETVEQLAGPIECHAVAVDVTNEEQIASAIDRAALLLGRIDILVNCAGVLARGSVVDASLADWQTCLAVNATGTFLCSRAVATHPRTAGHVAIVNIASAAAIRGMPTVAAYTASKGAVVSLTRSMAVDLGARGVRVNAICPGSIRTPMLEDLARQRGDGDLDAGLRWMASRYPLGRLGQPEEVAAAALFLASDEASFITGAVLTVDGGLTT